MSVNILDLIKNQLNNTLVPEAAKQLDESEAGISKAISGIIPVILGGLANNSENPSILNAIENSSTNEISQDLLNKTPNDSLISGILSSLFGDKLSNIVNTIATYSGISNNSSSKLLNKVTSVVLGFINQHSRDNNLDRNGISSLLNDQKGIISGLLPAGISLDSLSSKDWAKGYDFDGKSDKISNITNTSSQVNTTTNQPTPQPENGSIWKWLLPLLLLIASAYFIWKQCEIEKTTTTIINDSSTIDQDTISTNLPSSNNVKTDEDIDLNGVSLKGYKDGMEDRMIAFLKTDGYKNAANDDALKENWYDFDHVNFKIGSSSELESGSEGQLKNLVAILKAFPDAKIKIGGYTDKTGDETQNIQLSGDRAKFIKNWLEKEGVGTQVIGADGYGSEFAKVDPSASNEERAIDRKMSVRFTK